MDILFKILALLIPILFIPLSVALLLILISKLLLLITRKINKKETKPRKLSIVKHVLLAYVLCISAYILIGNYSPGPNRQWSNGLALATSIKPDIDEYYKVYGSFPSSNSDAGIAEPTSFRDTYVESVTISKGGVVTILYSGPRKSYGMGGHTLILKPQLNNGTISWSCKFGTLPNKYRNQYCATE